MEITIICLVAYGLDRLLADPYHWPHPVIAMGNFIQFYLKNSRYQQKSDRQKKWLGLGLLVSLVAVTILVSSCILYASRKISGDWLYYIVATYIVYACFSVEGLAREARKVQTVLQTETIEAARKQLSMIVGRDTTYLEQQEILAAVVETVAENITDGFVAPLFYTLIAGPVGALVYKAVNTLDSMVGYRYEPYTHIGYFSAKCDDLLNWIPARICRTMLWIAAWLLCFDWKQAIAISLRDARNHLSPNSGYSEAAVAGALGLQLGGTHTYAGVRIEKPTIGDATRPIEIADIERTNQLLYSSSFVSLVVLVGVRYLIGLF